MVSVAQLPTSMTVSVLVVRCPVPSVHGIRTSTGLMGTGNRAETYTGGLKYDANNVYLAARYTQTYNATLAGNFGLGKQSQNLELVAQYQFDFGLRPSLAFLRSKGKTGKHQWPQL